MSDSQPKVEKAVRELKQFARVMLQPGETRSVTLSLRPRDLAYFDVAGHRWKADAGEYVLEVGASSRDLRSKAVVKLERLYSEVVNHLSA